jgi:hypothetical protein
MQPQHTARAPIAALTDVEAFLLLAQTLKGTAQELRARQQRESGLQRALAARIAAMTKQCEDMAHRNARLREMWKQVRAELANDAAKDDEHGSSGAANH